MEPLDARKLHTMKAKGDNCQKLSDFRRTIRLHITLQSAESGYLQERSAWRNRLWQGKTRNRKREKKTRGRHDLWRAIFVLT